MLPIVEKILKAVSTVQSLGAASGGRVLNSATAFQKLTKSLEKTYDLNEEQAEQSAKLITKELKDAEESARNEQRLADVADALKDSVAYAAKAAIGLAKDSINISQTAYTTDKVFTRLIPTVNLVSSIAKHVVHIVTSTASAAVGGVLSFIPIAGLFLSSAAEGVFKAADAAAMAAIDIGSQMISMQLTNAQTYIDTYQNLSKVGVTYGGNFLEMGRAAHAGGMDIQSYSRFVVANVENLSKMGGGIKLASERVMSVSKELITSNTKFLALFGSVEDVNSAVATYMAIQSGYGINVYTNQKNINSKAETFITNLKVLQNASGINVDSLAQGISKHQENIAFQSRIAQLRGKVDDSLLDQASPLLTMLEQKLGPDMARLLEEGFEFDGKIFPSSAKTLAVPGAIDLVMKFSKLFRPGVNFQQAMVELAPALIEYSTNAGKSLNDYKAGGIEGAPEDIRRIASTLTIAFSSQAWAQGLLKGVETEFKNFNLPPNKENVVLYKAAMDMLTDKINQDDIIMKDFTNGNIAVMTKTLEEVTNGVIEATKKLAEWMPLLHEKLSSFLDTVAGMAPTAIDTSGINGDTTELWRRMVSGAQGGGAGGAEFGPGGPVALPNLTPADMKKALQELTEFTAGNTARGRELNAFGVPRKTHVHQGIDLGRTEGAPVLSRSTGTVKYVGPREGYGNTIEIDEGNGISTYYAHLHDRGMVNVGDKINVGQLIARVGHTETADGGIRDPKWRQTNIGSPVMASHLHFEYRKNGVAVDPEEFNRARAEAIRKAYEDKAHTIGGKAPRGDIMGEKGWEIFDSYSGHAQSKKMSQIFAEIQTTLYRLESTVRDRGWKLADLQESTYNS